VLKQKDRHYYDGRKSLLRKCDGRARKGDTKRRVLSSPNLCKRGIAKRAAKNAIKLYNEIRLHLSLDYKTPNMVYLKTA
jgi:hypothetical protein